MGTRNLTIVFADGAYKVAQYCQWDGYPAGQGRTVLEFLSTPGNIDRLRAGLAHTRIVSDAEITEKWASVGSTNGWATMAQSEAFKKKWPTLQRDCGAQVLEIIASADGRDIPLDLELVFAADGLFCEWAYVIDLDAGVLEVYKGFSKAPRDPNERFDFLADKCEGEYGYVRFAHSWSLNSLPELSEFVSALEPAEEAA